MNEETRLEAEQDTSLPEPEQKSDIALVEPVSTPTEDKPTPEAADAAPGGLILSRETLNALLGQEYDTVAAQKDPILMVAALLNAYLDEMKKQTDRLREGMEQDTSQPALRDGIGLPLDAIRTELAQKHNTIVAKDDPILMVGTLLNAYLGEVEDQNRRLREGMAKLLTDKTDGYVKGIKEITDSLAQSLSDSSVKAIEKTFVEHAKTLNTFRQNVIWTAAIVAISALVNVAAFVMQIRF